MKILGAYMQGSALRQGHPALREGLVFGIILGIFELVSGLLQNFVVPHNLYTFFSVMLLTLTIALILLAGVRASQHTGRVSTGALAGLIVELTSSVFGIINTLADIFVFDTFLHRGFLEATSGQAQQFNTNSFVIFVIIGIIIGFVIFPVLGAVIGTIGGLIGRRRAQLPMQI
jgi:hypothetical protein